MVTSLPDHVVRAVVAQSPGAICITDADLRPPGPAIVYVNAAFTDLTGYTRAEVEGRSPRILQGPLSERHVLDSLRAGLTSGTHWEGETINYRIDGTPFVMRWLVEPVDVGGEITHFVAIQEDATELRRLQRLRRALIEIEQSVVMALDPATLRTDIAHVLGASAAAIQAMLWAGRVTVVGFDAGGEPMAFAHEGVRHGLDPDEARRIAATDRPTVSRSGPVLTLVVPFRGDAASGALIVDELDEAGLSLIDEDHLEELAGVIERGVAIVGDRATRAQEGLAQQRALLPRSSPSAPGLEIAARYVPSHRSERAGGDWYDVVVRSDICLLVVGDVAGKGLRAAGQMGLARAHLRASLDAGLDVAAALAALHRFCRSEGMVATCLVVALDRAGAWSAMSAGHLPPIVSGGPNGPGHLTVPPGPPVGAFDGPFDAPVAQGTLEPGEVLVVYTDGLVADRNQSIDAGLAALLGAAHGAVSADDLCDRLLGAHAMDRADDVAMLAVRPTDFQEGAEQSA